ncbi:MaoC-like protein dehydratase [Actinoplanes sp. N902-109]|nr:MaoC-like protein dehydratase [Actinoplanes sp. N902-109]
MRTDVTLLPGLAGRDLGISGWHPVGAAAVAAFADVTGDHQWIHLDPHRAAEGPFGAPVAHGLLVLALVPALLAEVVEVTGVRHVINKGVQGARFLAPVRVGDRVRAWAGVQSARPRPREHWEVTWEVTVESEAAATAALRTTMTYLYRAAA